jgi:hypothetical protein
MDPETNSYGNDNQAVNTFYQSRLLVVGFNTPSNRNWLQGFNIPSKTISAMKNRISR